MSKIKEIMIIDSVWLNNEIAILNNTLSGACPESKTYAEAFAVRKALQMVAKEVKPCISLLEDAFDLGADAGKSGLTKERYLLQRCFEPAFIDDHPISIH